MTIFIILFSLCHLLCYLYDILPKMYKYYYLTIMVNIIVYLSTCSFIYPTLLMRNKTDI